MLLLAVAIDLSELASSISLLTFSMSSDINNWSVSTLGIQSVWNSKKPEDKSTEDLYFSDMPLGDKNVSLLHNCVLIFIFLP